MYKYFEMLLKQKNITASEVSKATGIASSTLSEWKSGKHQPSADKLRRIADFLEVTVDYLMTGKDTEKESESGTKWYFTDETAQKAQELFENPDLRILFDAARDSRPEDLQMAADLLKRLKETNRNG